MQNEACVVFPLQTLKLSMKIFSHTSSTAVFPVSAEPEATSEIEEDIPEGSSEGVGADERDNEDGKQSDDPNSAKRRGPRTTIKAKQVGRELLYDGELILHVYTRHKSTVLVLHDRRQKTLPF